MRAKVVLLRNDGNWLVEIIVGFLTLKLNDLIFLF